MATTMHTTLATLAFLMAAAPLAAQDTTTTPDTTPAPATDAAPAADAPAADAAQDAPAADAAPDAPAADAAPDAPAGTDVPAAGAPADGVSEPSVAAQQELPENLEITEYQDWEVRCDTSENGGCFMYQLATDGQGNPVTEITIVDLPADQEAAAGATVITPLGTLLSEGVVIQVDNGQARQYPFSWCTRSGCFSRFGFTDAEIATMKAGSVARMRIISVSAPDQPVILTLSLSGFTAAFNALSGS